MKRRQPIVENIVWHDATENECGVTSIGLETIFYKHAPQRVELVGYNGIILGDSVIYQNNQYTVVMVSRLGHIGLSVTGDLPYTICANDITELDKILS